MKKLLAALAVLVLASVGFALAQEEEQGRFVRFVERQLSTPDRRIQLGPIEGALSSDVRIGFITISDREGVWLRITDAHLVWSRLALLRGRLDIDLLEAASIEVLRPPVPAEDTEPIEPGAAFSLPALPVAVLLDRLSVPEVAIAEGIIGPAATLAVGGAITLQDGELDARVGIRRTDRPGDFTLIATFDDESRELGLQFTLAEPADGVIANALNIEGRPPIEFAINGSGPLSGWVANIALSADGADLLSGTSTIDREAEGLRFRTDVTGNLEPLVAALYDPYVAGGTELAFDATAGDDGSFVIREGRLTSGVANLSFAADLAPGGIPRALTVDGDLAAPDGGRLPLPGGGGASTLRSATFDVTLGGDAGDAFRLDVVLTDLVSPIVSTPEATIRGSGRAANLADPATRDLTFEITGNAAGIRSTDGGISDALGARLDIVARGAWQGTQPLTVQTADIVTGTLGAHFDGTIADVVRGNYRLNAADLAAFGALAQRPLSGAVDLDAAGTVGFDGLFDLMLDGTVTGVSLGIPAADGLLAGRTTLGGRAARIADGVQFESFRVENPQLSVTADGVVSDAAATLTADARLNDLSVVNPEASGPVGAMLTVGGTPAAPSISARVTSPQLRLSGETLTDLLAQFDGTLARGSAVPFDLDGRLAVTGALDGEPVRIAGTLVSAEGRRGLTGLDADVAGATASGDLALLDSGLLTGDLAVNVPQLRRLAALALQEATGSIRADVTLTVDDGTQNVAVNGAARDVSAAGVSLGEADVDMAVDDAFGLPALEGRANLRNLVAAGYDVVSADLVANRTGETTEVQLDADLGTGTLRAAGWFERREDGLAARLSEFRLAQDGFSADLTAPTTVDLSGQTITLGQTAITIGDGSIVVEGTIADDLDLTATIDALPLRIANLIRPDLAVGGTLSGTVDVAGTRASPSATADVRASDVTAAALVARGIEPLTLVARGSYADGSATLEEFSTEVAGGSVRASGTVGETLDVTASVDALPLALANAIRPELDLQGTLTGEARVEGTPSAPVATFDVSVDGASAAPTRAAELEPLDATATGSFADGTATLEAFRTTVGGGSVVASGTIGEVLDVTVDVAALPLALANVVQPDLDARGTLSGTAVATGSLAAPNARFEIEVAGASVAQTRASGIAPLDALARGTFADGTADLERFETSVGGGGIVASGRIGEVLDVEVRVTDLPLGLANAAVPDLDISGTVSATADVTGSLSAPEATFDVTVSDASAAPLRASGVGPVDAEVAGRLAGQTATLERARATIGGGVIEASGTVGRTLDVVAELTRLPLAVANGFVPDLGVGGTLSGRVTATGSLTDPRVQFDIVAPEVTAQPISAIGLPPAAIDASGTFAAGTVNLDDATVRIGGGLVTARGRVGQTLDVAVDVTDVPVSLANGVQPGLGLAGTLSGSAQASGSLADPQASFDLAVTGFSAAPLGAAGVAPLRIAASGSFADRTVRIAAVDAVGGGLDVSASGVVPLSGSGLAVSVDATAPLSIANGFLVERAASLSGTVVARVDVTGSIANPSFSGTVRSAGFEFRDPLSNLVLTDGVLSASLSGDRVVIDRLTATLGEGTVGVSGSVGIGAGFPADLTVTASNARYADGRLIAVTFSAGLDVSGNLAATPLITGRVDIDRAEISVPTRLSGTAALLEVYHVATPPDVLETLRRAEAGPFASTGEETGAGATGVVLDVTVSAPRRIFIRGRGIDAELGGEVRVTGPVSDVVPVGQFELIRGRVNILTQRITLDEGIITLTGDLDPTIRLVAETSTRDVTVRVIVEGQVSDPDIRFESVPELPQDEVLAQLIFGRSIEDLSPFQLAQLAAAVAELAGGGGPSIIEQVRVFSGLDDLDIVTSPSGGTSVQAGRYVAENVYLGVRAGESSGVTLNLDVNENVTIRAEALTDQSTLGIFFEREY